MNTFLNFEVLDNSLQRIGIFGIILLFAFVFSRYLSKIFSALIFRLFRKFTRESYGAKFDALVIPPLQYLVLLIIIRTAIESLIYPDRWKISFWNMPLQVLLDELLWMLVLFSFTWLLLRIVDYITYILRERAAATSSRTDDQLVPFVKDALKIFIIVNAIFILLGVVFDLDLTSLLAGLGIGGLAIAFAAQESIKDLFGSITVFLDKPFTVGDAVKIGDIEGSIEKVGIRSTRIRTPNLTLVTVPNKKMLDSNVDNFTLRTHRRVRQVVGLSYDTSVTQLKAITRDILAFLEVQFPRGADNIVVLDEFAENSLNLLIIYFIPFTTFDEHMRQKEAVNYRILEIISEHGSSLSFPVRDIRIDPDIFKKP